MTDYISRETAIEAMYKDAEAHQDHTFWTTQHEALLDIPAADVRPIPDGGIGEMSDGYHTFNGLYHQRMMLFAALVKAYKDRAWKSYKHEDGELCFGGVWFIVGIDTPEGSYTYHYESKDFDLFDCVELPVAKHWDGHTEADVGRLMSLDVRPKWISVEERLPEKEGKYLVCGKWRKTQMEYWVCDFKMFGPVQGWINDVKNPCVHYWMPLPEPPKEEN